MSLKRLLAVLALATGGALSTGTAHAGVLVESAGDCADRSMAQVFAPWLDPANYVLAPGGAAESAAGWTLAGGATITDGNEPWHIHSAGDSNHLKVPGGGVATTDAMCVGIDKPTIRFFSRSSGTGLGSSLQVDALVEDTLGVVSAVPVTTVLPSRSWTPGLAASPVLAALLPLLPGDQTPVAWRFRASGPGSWHVDDVYVDPWRVG